MYWHSCPHGHKVEETKLGWYCRSCNEVYAKENVVSLEAQTNHCLHSDAAKPTLKTNFTKQDVLDAIEAICGTPRR